MTKLFVEGFWGGLWGEDSRCPRSVRRVAEVGLRATLPPLRAGRDNGLWMIDHNPLAKEKFREEFYLPGSTGSSVAADRAMAGEAPRPRPRRSSSPMSSLSLVRARLTRLLIVPISTPQMTAASS
jgi:hypothetical protein